MLTAIQFHNDLQIDADKIRYIRADGTLPTEFQTEQAPIA
jgi:hypothetical protein